MKKIKKLLVLVVAVTVLVGCFGTGSAYAAKKKVHGYYFYTLTSNHSFKKTKLSVKFKKRKMIVKGSPTKVHKFKYGYDQSEPLKYKKRIYKLNKKTKYYLEFGTKKTKISKKKAKKYIKNKKFDFHIMFKGKKALKIFVLPSTD